MKRGNPPDGAIVFKPRDTEVINFEIITPLFGGGVHIQRQNAHLKEPDAVTPVRTASIRGQLRFWWRAAWGCQFERGRMFEEEAAIWGRAAFTRKVKDREVTVGPGKVSIRLDSSARNAGAEDGVGRSPGRAYGAFPLQPARDASDKTPGRLTRLAGDTRLILTFTGLTDEQKKGVQRAVNAWLMFGGLGGRTRRGFGAVHPVGSQSPTALLSELKQGLVNRAQIPSLVGAEVVVRPVGQPTALDALDQGLDRLRTFRQGENFGRNPGSEPKRPGRSRWPEPDAIRRITHSRSQRHAIPLTKTDAFPRAAFGLPIIFHFKDGGDPSDTTLKPRGLDRFASPLIIRPFRNRNSRYDVLALRLGGPGPGLVDLTDSRTGGTLAPAVTTLTPAALATDLGPLNGMLRSQTDVLAAFLAFFQK